MKTTLIYDHSFDGFLSTVFAVYEQKLHEVNVIKEADYSSDDLWGDAQIIHTDSAKALRVWQKLQTVVEAPGLTRLMHTFLADTEPVEGLLLAAIRRFLQQPNQHIWLDYADETMLALAQYSKKISRESHRIKALVRFEELEDGMLAARIAPDFNVLPLSIAHFQQRYRHENWVIFDTARQFGLWYQHGQCQLVSPEADFLARPQAYYSTQEAHYQSLWRQFFHSVTITERINPQAHRRVLPQRYWRYLTEKQQR